MDSPLNTLKFTKYRQYSIWSKLYANANLEILFHFMLVMGLKFYIILHFFHLYISPHFTLVMRIWCLDFMTPRICYFPSAHWNIPLLFKLVMKIFTPCILWCLKFVILLLFISIFGLILCFRGWIWRLVFWYLATDWRGRGK